MKPSRYNHFFPYSDTQSIAYNAYSNSLALIDNDKLEAYNNFCEHGKELSPELTEDLKKGFFIIEDFADELESLQFNMLQSRYNTQYLGLTLAPTNDCNFACTYCYEKNALSSKYMTQEVQDKIVEMLESRKKAISYFSVAWYGGEPLMAFEIVESLSKRFIEICKENDITYSAFMISNGYLLSHDILIKLPELEIKSMQITIDGNEDVHNRNRPLVDGGKTYDTIMKNLINNYDIIPKISLRINVDKSNVDAGRDIYQLLKENSMLEKVTPYYGMIHNMEDSEDEGCLRTCDFAEISYDFANELTDKSQHNIVQYPSLKSNYCGADRLSGYLIDAEGYVYKCWHDLGVPNKRIGSLVEDFRHINNTYFEYMLFDPTLKEPCKDCNLLPVCMGGCPSMRLTGDIDRCTNHKYVLEKCLLNATASIKAKREADKSNS
jgi:uncharacterized protein